MSRTKLFAPGFTVSLALALATLGGCAANGEEPKASKPAAAAGKPEMKLPPGWTEADMQACMIAGTPGKLHERLAKDAGTWHGKNTMWMAPGAEPVSCTSTTTITPVMDGRYTRAEIKGEMPGMGPYHGLGFYGYDNVSQKFVATFIDSHSTGIMNGTGELSGDGKTLTWTYGYNCPLTKKPVTMREVATNTGANTKLLEMFGTDPKSGQEFKMMSIELTKK